MSGFSMHDEPPSTACLDFLSGSPIRPVEWEPHSEPFGSGQTRLAIVFELLIFHWDSQSSNW